MGKNLAIATGRRIQQRRRRKGRRQLLPTIGGVSAVASTSRTMAPVRVNQQVTPVVKEERVISTEQCQIVINSEQGDHADAASTKVDPMNPTLWPKLSQKAPLFTEYDINSLTFRYEPIKGTSYNGQVAFGFLPQTQIEGTDMYSSTSMCNLPCVVYGSVGSPMQLTIKPQDMSKGGKGLFMPGFDVTAQDYLNYYAGNFYYLTYACDSDNTECGRFSVSYNIVLKRSKLDTSPTASSFNRGTGTTVRGQAHLEISASSTTQITGTYASVRPQTVIVHSQGATTAPTITLNGAAVAAVNTWVIGTDTITTFSLGRTFGQQTLVVSRGGAATLTGILLISTSYGF